VQAIPEIFKVLSPETCVDVVLPKLLLVADDAVPNVKFNLCKVLEVCLPTSL
jgi:hypothetical protein